MLNPAILLASTRRPAFESPVFTGDFNAQISDGLGEFPDVSRSSLNIVPGDLVLKFLAINEEDPVAIPSGILLVDEVFPVENFPDFDAVNLKVVAEIQTTSSGSFGTLSTFNAPGVLTYLRITNAGTPNPALSQSAQGSSASPTAPDLVTTVSNSLVFRTFAANDDSIVQDSGYPLGTTGILVRADPGNNNTGFSFGVAFEQNAAPGAVGAAAFSLTSAEPWSAATFEIVPG